MATKKKVFISYAREDAAFAREVVRQLRRSKVPAWQDVQELRGGDHWQERIDEALSDARSLIVVMSPAASRSMYVTYEWAFALFKNVPVVPVLRKPTELHPRLARLHYVDFSRKDQRKPWVKLLQALSQKRQRIQFTGAPVIRARFDMTNGKPSRVKGGEYVITLWVENAPPLVSAVRYEAHDESFTEPTWSETNSEEQFRTWMQSYGDVLVTASLRQRSRQLFRTGVTLLEALRDTHSRSRDPHIRRALKDIEEN